MMNNITYSNILKEIRKKHNLTQIHLAQILGTTAGTINRWENGHMKPDEVHMPNIHFLYSVSPDELRNVLIRQQEAMLKVNRESNSNNVAKGLLTAGGFLAGAVLMGIILDKLFDD